MITIGIVGAGIVGERIIKQMLQETGIEIRGLYDEQPDRLAALEKEYKIPVYESLEALLHADIDWLYIGTPPAFHAEIAIKAARTGVNILCEKPLAHNAAAGEQMALAANQNRIHTAMHFPLMYSPAVHEMVRRIRNKSIGKIVRIELQTFFPDWPRPWQQNPWIASRSQGGFVREVFPHYLQLINRIFGGLTIQSHQITYPEQQELCETGIIAHGHSAGAIPLLLTGISGTGQKELLEFKVYGEKGVLTLQNWSELYLSEKYEERKRLADFPLVPSLFSSMREQSTFLVPFEEGLTIQRHIDQLLGSE